MCAIMHAGAMADPDLTSMHNVVGVGVMYFYESECMMHDDLEG